MFTNNFKNSSARLIRSAGYAVTFKSITFGVYDPETLTSSNTETSYNIKAASMRNSYTDTLNPAYVGKVIKTYIISALDLPVAPKTGDKIVTPDSTVTVQVVKPYEYSAVSAAWKVVCIKD